MSAQQGPEALDTMHTADDVAARIEAQINLRRLSARDEASSIAADPLDDLRARQWVNSHLPIGWPHMPRGLGSKLVVILQKVTRRLLRWYINPLVEQQNEFNEAVLVALQDVYRHVELKAAVMDAEREAIRVELDRLRAALSVTAHPDDHEPTDNAGILPLPWSVATLLPPASPQWLDAQLQRVLFGQRLAGIVRPLLLVGDQRGELAARANELGLRTQTWEHLVPDALDALPPASVAGCVWASGVWRHEPAACLRILTAIHAALVPSAPLVIETITPDDATALARYLWADPAAVRPYPPDLLLALLRLAGFESASELAQPPDSVLTAICGYRI